MIAPTVPTRVRHETPRLTAKQRFGHWLFARLPITRFLFDQLRVEANAWLVTAQNRMLPGRRRMLSALREQRDLYVNVACGPQVIGEFVNLDLMGTAPGVFRWDCRRSLPMANASVAGIRAEQFVEHLETREELPRFLRDCLRVLNPGGVLRVIVPDASRYLRAYREESLDGFRELAVPEPFPEDLPTRMDIVNHVFHQWSEHRWGYDFETLAHRLRTAGFTRVEQTSFGRSLLPTLAHDMVVHAPYSLYVDAVKEARTAADRQPGRSAAVNAR